MSDHSLCFCGMPKITIRKGKLGATCGSKECRNEIKRRNAVEWQAQKRTSGVKTTCMGSNCQKEFLSPLDRDGRKLHHFCLSCRHSRLNDRETTLWAEYWER